MPTLFIKDILKGKVVIVGVGNTLRGDDGLGPALIDEIKDKVEFVCIDAGSTPENYTDKIIKERPDTILIVDALHLDRKPGEYEILKKEGIRKSGLSTHNISPNMFIEYLEKQTKARIYMLGVQPESLTFGQEISDSVKRTLEEIEIEICTVSQPNREPFPNPIGKLSPKKNA